MATEIITKEDLDNFRHQLIQDIKALLNSSVTHASKQWLRSAEVRKLLHISPGTLQNLRINGSLRYTKVGGIMYYKQEDIQCMLEGKEARG